MKRQENEEVNCEDIVYSDDYLQIIKQSIGEIEFDSRCAIFLDPQYLAYYVPRETDSCIKDYIRFDPAEIPNLYGLYGEKSVAAAGISPVYDLPGLKLRGKDVLVGVIDTGINYTHGAFINRDGNTKIVSIWDQTRPGNPPENFTYGWEYSREDINNALSSKDPESVVPEKDDIGHGTFIAGVAAGNTKEEFRFTGAAPDAELVVVKMKQANKCLRETYLIKDGAIAYNNVDLLTGVQYCILKARSLNKPVAILIGCGSTYEGHDGKSLTERILATYGDLTGVVIVLAGGNEAISGHHYEGDLGESGDITDVLINIPSGEKGSVVTYWGSSYDKASIEIISPRGTSSGRLKTIVGKLQTVNFIEEETSIIVKQTLVQERTPYQSYVFRIEKPSPGLWTIRVIAEIVLSGRFDIYLPRNGFCEEGTKFLQPSPDTTVTPPSTNARTITVGAINYVNSSIWPESSRGFTRIDEVKPDIVAPGVDVIGPVAENEYGIMSGTSISAAITAGACAILLEWGIVGGNLPTMDTLTAKSLLIYGARRKKEFVYPNKQYGYGELDLLGTFKVIQS